MESGSQPAEPASKRTYKLVDVLGTFIAVLTLTLPLFAISSYSNQSGAPRPPFSQQAPPGK